jgi:hypothetical protein
VVIFDDIDMVTIDYLTDAKSLASVLTEGQTTVPIPGLDGYAAVKFIFANYRKSTFGSYYELIVVTPCLCGDGLWLYVPLIYVTNNDSAMAAGREGDGFPKKIADIDLMRFGDRMDMTFSRGSARASASVTIGSKLFSSPLPAKEPVELEFPYNMTLPLPDPTGKEQKLALDWLCTRFLPDAPLAQLVGLTFEAEGDFYEARDVSFAMHGSKDDPLDMLPVRELLGGSVFFGFLTLKGKKKLVKELPGAEKLVKDLK